MESFAELFESSGDDKKMRPGTILEGAVIQVGSEYITVHVGLKSEANIPIEQFRDMDGSVSVSVDDMVEVVLDAVEDGFGLTRLSREKAKRERVWKQLKSAYENVETVTGLINGKVKGGFTVNINDVRAFLPGSLVDVRPVRETAYLEGKPLDFKVIKLDRRRNNVVVSRRAVVDEESLVERDVLLQKLVDGAVLPGVVKNLTEYGAFVDLGGIDGLLHITDMAWRRVKHPTEVVNIGDAIDVMVLKFDRERNRVSLGLKQMGDDPWIGISERCPEGSRVLGLVTNIADYGCFVKIEDCVEGLVHVSEMDWTNKNIHPTKVAQLGDEVEVMVLDIDEERRRISLGIKQCRPNPWEEFAAQYKKGDHVTGKIKSITDFGLFVGLPGSIDGLVHLSDLSWNSSSEPIIRNFRKGEDIETVVLLVDAERERISLGIKQLDKDIFSIFLASNPKGSNVTGTVSEVDARNVVVDVGGIEGRIKASELSHERVEDARTVVNVGDKIEAKFTGVDRKARVITLSVKAKESDEEAQTISYYSPDAVDQGNKLGDILKRQVNNASDD